MPINLDMRERFAKCFIWIDVLFGLETWTVRKKEVNYVESFEMWLGQRWEIIKCTDKLKNREVLEIVKEGKNMLHAVRKKKADWLNRILRTNCTQKVIIEGNIIGKESRTKKT